ncbi:uncharacterized protein L199_002110 [Kwoniella botswanensis]|uniref:uncharacterized protein n=1 Tax=Kwoniella botswanensis TaxID=1268659 RepID=UPI00315CAB93
MPPNPKIDQQPTAEHRWTENQVCIRLHKIHLNPQLHQLFFLKHDDNSPSSIRMEQQLSLEVLRDTKWMEWMIKHQRVLKDSRTGGLVVRDQWPRGLRVVSRLFDELHPLAEKIKCCLGKVRSKQLKKDPLVHRLWKKWQDESRHTWNFKYVAIKTTLNPKWIYTKSSFSNSIGIGQDIQSGLIIQNDPGQSTTNHTHPSVNGNHNYGSISDPHSTVQLTRSKHRLDFDKILARVEGRPPFSATSPTHSNTLRPPQVISIGKDELQDGATCMSSPSESPSITNRDISEVLTTESLSGYYNSMNDISLDPPLELAGNRSSATLIMNSDPDSTLVHSHLQTLSAKSQRYHIPKKEKEEGSERDQRLISALLIFIALEPEYLHSRCMSKLQVIYEGTLNSREEAIIRIVQQMGGQTREAREGDIVITVDEDRLKQRYRLVSGDHPTNQEKNRQSDQDHVAITLVGLVELIGECRKKELEERTMDLLTF